MPAFGVDICCVSNKRGYVVLPSKQCDVVVDTVFLADAE